MDDTKREALAGLLLGLVPPNGSAIGNQSLRERFLEVAKASGYKNAGSALDVAFESLREELLQKGVLAKGKGRGGSVLRAQAADAASFELGALTPSLPEEPASPAKAKAAAVRKPAGEGEPQVLSYRHSGRRKNNPQVGLVNEATDPPQPKTSWRYDPHLDPVLNFDSARAGVEKLVDDALASGDAEVMRAALAELKRAGSPYLQWTGKAERTSFSVDTVSLHVHERIDPMSILAAVSKRLKEGKVGKTSGIQPSLFDAPFENLPLREAVDFYKHDRGWSNRMIAGDSLLVMNSLLQKEGMAGQVQMIYFDPPYGIKYGSNFQPFTGKRDVKDGRDEGRITGPFTVEAVPFPTVLSLDEAEQPKDADVSIARSGESARQHSWRDELLKTGIRGKGGQMLKFASLETLPGTVCLHALGVLDTGERVVVSFGPEHGALEQRQVEHALREAGELFPLPKMAVFCAFEFDPEAAKDIDAFKGITALKAKMNTDLLTEDLKKARSSNQSFWLMGQPDVELRKRKDGLYEIEVNGFDYFDTAKGELVSGGKARIAMWLLDIDYDDRSLFPRQVFFPMAGKDEGWHKLKKDIRAELDEDLLEKFKGTVSLPFEAGENKKVAVKIVDDRGIESVKVIPLP